MEGAITMAPNSVTRSVMFRLFVLVAASAALIGCDGNPVSPTAKTKGCASGDGYPSPVRVELTNANCGDSPAQHAPTAPAPTAPVAADTAVVIARAKQVMDRYPSAKVLANGTQVFGPSGCVDAATIGDVAVWYLTNLPRGASVTDKAYHYHPDVNCLPTIDNGRHDNEHFRFFWVSDTMLLVEYDLTAYPCRGRQQPDLDINGELAFGMTFYRNQHSAASCDPPIIDACPAGLDVAKTKDSVANDGVNGYQTFFVKPGYQVTVSLASWKIPVPTPALDQFNTWSVQNRDGYKLVTLTETKTLSVPIGGDRQFDGACGPAPEQYNPSNSADYNSRIIGWKGCEGSDAEHCTWVANNLLAQGVR